MLTKRHVGSGNEIAIRFVRLDSEHAQSDGKSVNRGLPVLDQPRSQGLFPKAREKTLGTRLGVRPGSNYITST